MPARYRERNEYKDHVGLLEIPVFNQTTEIVREIGTYEDCFDFVGSPETANELELAFRWKSDKLMNGEQYHSNGTLLRRVTDVPVGGGSISVPDPRLQYPVPGFLERNKIAWEILSKSNPNVPHVSVPTFVGELKDIPMLFKGWGQGRINDFAKGNISWQFGIKPMISDLRKLLQFQKAVQQRMDWLKQIRDGKYLRRKVQLGKRHKNLPWSGEVILHSQAVTYVKGRSRISYHLRDWGTVQWKLLDWFEIPNNNDELAKLATRLTFDFSLDGALSTAWSLVPWTWLVDWFAGVGDVIDATRNTVPLTHSHLCYMRTLDAIREYEITDDGPDWITLSGDRFEFMARKERFPVSPTLPFPVSVPAITGRQWSILGSLGVMKSRRF